ncbi:MAG TPA: phosphatase PAP2 family protein [Terriglobales bacterium]|nr:phosphatase PAP2 family protein [Terriglobales bacterium]
MSGAFEINPTLSFTLLGSCAIYAVTRPTRSAWASAAVIAVLMRIAVTRLKGGLGAYYGAEWITWGTFVGLASIVVLAAQTARARMLGVDARHRLLRETFFAACVFPILTLLVGDALRFITWIEPKTLDAFLLKFDGSLGFQPSFLLGRALNSVSFWWGPTTVVYYALPLGVGILYASHLKAMRSGRETRVSILGLFLSLIAAGTCIYAIFPATGPAHSYPNVYPWHSPQLSQIVVEPLMGGNALRNCMPSLHFAGALAIFWNAHLWPRWGRALAGAFLLATAFATLALGEHYLVDLVVAFPFALFFQAAWSERIPWRDPRRFRALLGGALGTIAWLVVLRYGLQVFLLAPLIPWAALIATISWYWLTKRSLDLAAQDAS